MDDYAETILKSSDFYIREAKRIQAKLHKAKTVKEKSEILVELQNIKKKIAFEISEINKILGDQD
jgi:hypothetical protein